MMNALVINTHHFSEGVTLTIHDSKSSWTIDRENQRFKYGTAIDFCGQISQKAGTLDPVNSFDDFVLLIKLVFEFTGCEGLKIESQQNLTQWDIINHIYNTPLEHHVRFVHVGRCGCNMGHCSEIVSVTIDNKDYKTYGDLMALFGCPTEREMTDIFIMNIPIVFGLHWNK